MLRPKFSDNWIKNCAKEKFLKPNDLKGDKHAEAEADHIVLFIDDYESTIKVISQLFDGTADRFSGMNRVKSKLEKNISKCISWSAKTTAVVRKVLQRCYFLWVLRGYLE